MNRSFLLVVLLFLFPSDPFQAQTVTRKSAPATNTSKHTDAKAVPGSYDTNPETKILYDDGIARLEMGQVSEAVERFQKALQLDPEYVPAYSALGRAFFKLRQWENASETFRHAIALKAKKRESELQKNQLHGTEPDVAPTVPPAPAIRPKGTSSSSTDKLNKPLPTLPVNAAFTIASLGSGLKPAQVPQAVATARAKTRFDEQLGSPPPELREKIDAAEPPTPSTSAVAPSITRPTPTDVDVQVARNVTPLRPPTESKSVAAASPTSLTDDIALTTVYRVGPQDVLEIRLNNAQPQQSTVFKVTRSGLLEHPQLNEPLPVTGLTVEEIRARIETDLKASVENPKALVGVLEYASHSLVIDGLVKNPGTKFLKSEAVPLAVIVAEAQPLPAAARVTVVRTGNQLLETDLNHTADTRLLVHPGDVITLQPQVNESLYVEGKVKFPGEKTYRFGLTLTQAIIMAGGATSNSSVAEIVRDSDGGVPARFDLKAIQEGKAADPPVKPRDRIILH
jgi:protein involved in polysaccharide export with SLBB domain